MSVKYVCDVCGGEYLPQYWQHTDRIVLAFPRHSVGDLSESQDDVDEYDVCSWECVHAFAAQIVTEDEEEPIKVHVPEEHVGHIGPDEEKGPEEESSPTKKPTLRPVETVAEESGERMVRLKPFDTSREMPDKNFDPRKNTIPGLKVDGRPV